MSNAIAIQHREHILARIEAGAILKTIGAEFSITPAAISNQLANDPEYRKARENGALARLEGQFDAIISSNEPSDVTRAREGFRAAAWFAEREFPERWGQKVEITQHVDITVALDSARERVGRVIEHDAAPAHVAQKTGSSE